MEQKISDPRLVLKATAPRASRSLLYRARLGLNSGNQADRSVIALQAAAGYGKSSLLLQWRREALESGAIVAWLTLDAHDDDACFARGLHAALSIGSGSGQFVHESPDLTASPASGMEEVTLWLAEVAGMAVEVVLMLDDAHTLPEATVTASLMYLLHNAPPNLRVIMACRRPLALNFLDLLTKGGLLQLGTDDLALTLEETAGVLQGSLGETVDSDSGVRLYELTEGWPLGVQLVLSSAMKSGALREAIAEFSSRSGDLQHYFMQCLLEGQTEDTVMFLTDISCLNRVHPDLCQTLTGNEDSSALLSHLRDETPIFRDNDSGDWMRIHPIAREFLQERLRRLPLEHRRELHVRAARWLAKQDMVDEAAEHACLAGDRDFAFDLVEQCLYGILTRGRVLQVLAWMERLPGEEIRRRPKIRLATGWALAQSERHSEASELIGSVMNDPQASAAERCEAAEICAAAAFFSDNIGQMQEYLAPWQEFLSDQPVLQQVAGTNVSAAIELFQGKPENVQYHLDRVRGVRRSPELNYVLGWTGWFSGFAYLWEGQVTLAEEVLRASLLRAEEASGRRSPIAVMLAATLAATLWENNQLQEADMLLAGRLDVLEQHAPPDAIIHGYVTAARLAAAGGSPEKGHDLIEHLRAIGDTRGLPRLCVTSLAEKIRVLALSDQEAACSARLQRLVEIDQTMDWGMLQPLVETQVGIARAYTAISGHRWDQALPVLEVIDAVAQRLRLVREVIQVQLLQGLARQRQGENSSQQLQGAVNLAKTLGLERLPADTHPSCAEQLFDETAVETSIGKGASSGQAGAAQIKSQAHVVENPLLTPKEGEVLQFLAGNLNNKQIASAMGVSGETVKWHLKNMFNKLQAGSRQHLVGRARMLGILE